MKRCLLTFALAASCLQGHSQGQFFFSNVTAPTRVGTLAGPVAGPAYWAHMRAGTTADSMEPVGPDRPHEVDGTVFGGAVEVPGIPETGYAYVQMVAWDGSLWGTSLPAVPAEQLGATDVVRVFLGGSAFPINAPYFTQPAIVPVPEPSLLALASLAGMAALFLWRRGRR